MNGALFQGSREIPSKQIGYVLRILGQNPTEDDIVEMVMKVMLRIYKNVARKLSELGNPDLRICLDKKYKRTLESLSKCGHKGCTWYKEFCTFLGSDEVKNDLAVNEANKRCLLK